MNTAFTPANALMPTMVPDAIPDNPIVFAPAVQPTTKSSLPFRDALGRFTKGGKPGPGRPRKQVAKTFVDPFHVYKRCFDMDETDNIWKLVVIKYGTKAARILLAEIEAESGPICFRHLAIEAITAGEQKDRDMAANKTSAASKSPVRAKRRRTTARRKRK